MHRPRTVFIVSSGRSGTQMMHKLLSMYPQVEAHHEYLCTHVQPLAVRYYMGLVDLDEAVQELAKIHGSAVYYCTKDFFIDSSNKLSWLIEPLNRLFPDCKFIHLVRDGRKVVSSFYNKLRDEIYDDRSTEILGAWVRNPDDIPSPPPEKKYWWNWPRPDSPWHDEFPSFNQFERICFHWAEVNRCIIDHLDKIDRDRKRMYRLEDLVSSREVLSDLLKFIGLPYKEECFRILRRPHNVHHPVNYPLTEEQRRRFIEIAGHYLRLFGYNAEDEEYEVIYHPEEHHDPVSP